MYNKIHTYTTDRISSKAAALLAIYAAAVELLARAIGLAALLVGSAFMTNETLSLETLEIIVLFTVLYGRSPVGYDLLTANEDTFFGTVDILLPIAAVGYLAAVAIVYGVHRRYVSD